MNVGKVNSEMRRSTRSLRLKESVVAAFWEPAPSIRARFSEFTVSDWIKALFWLDVSGLALYFLDRLTQLGIEDCLPEPILVRLRNNLADNRKRTVWLFDEAVTIAGALQQCNVSFAFLKGFTLPSESAPDNALRCQMDLDLLIRESDANVVKKCLGELGYVLDAVSDMTWEFKEGLSGLSTIDDIYMVRQERALDLHLLPDTGHGTTFPIPDRLSRAQTRTINGVDLPVLSRADIFVQQALHLFKHLCSEHTRAFWVLEFWRHASARQNDTDFWREVELIAATEPKADMAIGVATMLATLMFGKFVSEHVCHWSMERLSPAICLWLQLYGHRVLLSDSPRSKLYLLLQPQLLPDARLHQEVRRRLIFPIHWPQRVTRSEAGEPTISRLLRHWAQARFALSRLRFHTIEGLRFAVESMRWQRRLAGVAQ